MQVAGKQLLNYLMNINPNLKEKSHFHQKPKMEEFKFKIEIFKQILVRRFFINLQIPILKMNMIDLINNKDY